MKGIRLIYIYLLLIIYIPLGIYLKNLNPTRYSLIINPLLMVILSLIIIFTHNNNFNRAQKNLKRYAKSVFIVMLVYILVYCILGLIFGFVRSPFSKQIGTLLKNVWQYIVSAIAIEYVRSTILKANKRNKLIIFITIIIFILISVNVPYLLNTFNNKEASFSYIFGTIIPLIFSEVLCTYLVLVGNYKLSIIYSGFNKAIVILLPVYPNLDWFSNGILGILLPIITYVVVKYDVVQSDKKIKRYKKREYNPILYIPLFTFVITFVAFMIGLFKYEPIAILSNSMYPIFSRGDVIIFYNPTEIEKNEIKVGDIIIYAYKGQYISHRVIKIVDKYDEIVFETKGDNNNSPDLELVKKNQIKGIYKFSVKYVGYPSVYLNDFIKGKEAEVEIK